LRSLDQISEKFMFLLPKLLQINFRSANGEREIVGLRLWGVGGEEIKINNQQSTINNQQSTITDCKEL
jgi:hypothetical protein